ncbi:bifunctional 2-polyprenyl-6-hydroxyphenol methylase/3-demethylubiquinol 3-O-methyltransferase UbiG [Conexibacter sp. SYSU D00693]|uniref:class I SAM-dependent methyltransferase n=1 Tax=Conexibacter sp. SYSU D00693 TaxID=2812560 RepID=UPI00196A7491|nr:class I SAM-dependent methyltransferase [Conexibacter sp. SYSU D00693]
MSLAEWTWITAARVRRKLRGRTSREDDHAARSAWIRAHVPGRSFVDVGGLYGINGDIAFQAAAAGASPVTCFDAGDPTPEFLERRASTGLDVRIVQGDLEDPLSVERIGAHDVVWCSGVVYHTPNPVQQLIHLRRICRETLYLGSHTMAEVPGVKQACVFYPYLPEGSRRVHESPHWQAAGSGAGSIGGPFIDAPMLGHNNFWWGITPSALEAMVRTACFEVVERIENHSSPWFTELVCKPVDRLPTQPPFDFFRKRAEARAAGVEPPPFDGSAYDGLLAPPPDPAVDDAPPS